MATLHRGTAFVITDDAGDVGGGEQGFYFDDVRCLSSLRLSLDGTALVPVGVDQAGDDRVTFWLTNRKTQHLAADKVLVRRRVSFDDGIVEEIELRSFCDAPTDVTLRLDVDAGFEDLFAVKQRALAGHGDPGEAHSDASSQGATLTLHRRLRGTSCTTTVDFEPQPSFDERSAALARCVRSGETVTWKIRAHSSIEHAGAPPRATAVLRHLDELRSHRAHPALPTVESDHPILARAYARASRDLEDLRLQSGQDFSDENAIAAGIPWYMALFGRDSLIAACESMLHDPSLGRGTLRALAHLQGRRVDPASEEQPGRILHEHRPHLRASVRRNIPRFPYYGTVDATPLFIVTLSEHTRVTGDIDLVRELWPNVTRALEWIAAFGDRDGDGFVEYQTRAGGFLVNEGWKDSADSVRFADGRLASQPIALVEVQGYVADAFARASEMARLVGEDARARDLDGRARTLRRQIAARFWLAQRRCFAEALDGDKRLVDSLTSNPGHLLWARVLDDEHARAVADALLGEEMFSGWGVRTMGAREGGYDPVSYHNGSVWPHDNALLLDGMARYRLDAQATRLATALLAALARFPDLRFPELFSGVGRDEASRPVAYPHANRPQAWAAAAVPTLVRALLGLEVDALARRITLRPLPLDGASFLRLRDVPVGDTRITVEARYEGGRAHCRIDGAPRGWTVDGDTSPRENNRD